MTLIAALRSITSLPQSAQAPATSAIIEEWRKKSPLVQKVVAGETTFTSAVSQLVALNSELGLRKNNNLYTNTNFGRISIEAKASLGDILTYTTYRTSGRLSHLVDLTEPIGLKRYVLQTLKIYLLLFIATAILTATILYLSSDTKEFSATWIVQAIEFLAAILGVTFLLDSTLNGYPSEISTRKDLAQRVLADARYLDEVITKK